MPSVDGPSRARALLPAIFVMAVFLVTAPVVDAAPPANDAFSSATALPAALPSNQSGNNTGATKEIDEPNHAGDPGGHSVWYSWTPASSGPVGIRNPCFGGIDALVAVYTGAAINSLTPVASNESEFPPSCFFSETPEAEFEATAGTTYWIAVDGRDGVQGSFELVFDAPPANDDFANAQSITAELPQIVSSSTRLSGKEIGEPNHAGEPGGHSLWYSWTPSSSEEVAISTCSSFGSLDSILAVYTGSSLGALTEVASNDDGSSPEGFFGCWATGSEVVLSAMAGTEYRIAVDGSQGTVGRFNLQIRGRPQNDDFASPQVLGANLPTSAVQPSNELATSEVSEPEHGGSAGGHSVWFSWTPSSSGSVAIWTCNHEGNDFDTLLAVYTGSTFAGLTPIASNDDGLRTQCRETDSEVRFDATAGTTYRIAVDGKDGDQGRFDLSLEAPPNNDDFESAKELSPDLPISNSGTTRLATKQAGEPNHAGEPGGNSVWYSWTPSSSGPVTVSTCPYFETRPDTLLTVYTGDSVDDLTPVAGNDDSSEACKEFGSAVEIDVTAGMTYRIAVDGKGGSEGIFSLDLNGRPDNDDFANAEALWPEPMTTGGSTVFATKQAGEPNHAGEPGGHSLWYSWTPSSGGPVDITACGHNPSVDTLLAVYTGSSVGALTPVASNDDAVNEPANELCESPDLYSEVEFDAVAGTTYRIAVDTKGGVGRFGLAFEFPPDNDDFADAASLFSGLPTYGSAVTKLTTREAGEPDHAGDPGGHSVWYTWTPAKSGPIEISACAYYGDLDTLLAVYTGSNMAGLTPVVSADDGASEKRCQSSDSEAQFTAAAGTTYRIAVDGKAGSTGGFQLILEGKAPNDDFGKAQPLGGSLSVWESASNRFATRQAGEPDHAGGPGGASIWFKWTAPRSGPVSVDTCGSSFDTLLAVYTGTSLETLAPVQSDDEGSGKCAPQSKLAFAAVANTVYRIAADGKDGEQGHVELRLDDSPGNDDFDKAETIPGSLGWYWPGWTSLATKEAGEPDHGNDPGGHSVWYSWTPFKSAEVEIDACTETFDPLLAVYTGIAVEGLTPVPTTDGAGECEEGGQSIRFAAIAGIHYRLAVDGKEGDEGHFELHPRPALAPVRLLTVSKVGEGAGSVASSPSGIGCGSTCAYQFEDGTEVTLTANPAAGSTFAGWSGGGCSGAGPCQLVLSADTTVTATFDALSAGGEGIGSGGGTGNASTPPVPSSPPPPKKPLKCKRGFKKKIVRGKPKCVKKKKHHTHRQR